MMEMVERETPPNQLARGPLPVAEALRNNTIQRDSEAVQYQSHAQGNINSTGRRCWCVRRRPVYQA